MAGPIDRNAIMDQIVSDLKIKRRSERKAAPPARPMETDWDYTAIVIHNSGHSHLDDMQKIQNFDFSHRDWDGRSSREARFCRMAPHRRA